MTTLQPLVSEMLLGSTWTPVTPLIERDDGNGVRIQRRPLNFAERTGPTTASWIFKNPSNNLYGRNPSSAYFGLLGRNTQVRHRLLMFGDTFDGRTVASDWGNGWVRVGGTAASDYAVAGNVATHTHTAVNSLHISTRETGTVDHDTAADMSWAIGTALTASVTQWVGIRYVDSNNYLGVQLALTTTATMTLQLFKQVGGVLTMLGSPTTVGTGHVGGDVWRVRIRANGRWFSAKAWVPAASAEPTSWTQGAAITDTTVFGAATKAALMSRLETGNTNPLSVVSTFNNFEANSYRFWGEIPSFSPQRDDTGQYKTVPVTAAGFGQRLGAGTRPLASALTRAMDGIGDGDIIPIAHWPMEEPSGATQLGNLRAGGPATVSGAVSLASYSGASGSKSVPVLSAGGQIAGVYPPMTINASSLGESAWQVQFMGVVSSALAATTTFMDINVQNVGGDNVIRWRIDWDNTFKILSARPFTSLGTTLTGAALDFGSNPTFYDRPLLFSLTVFQSSVGGFCSQQFTGRSPALPGILFGSNTIGAGLTTTVPKPQSWHAYGTAANAGWSFSHHAIYIDPALFSTPNIANNAAVVDGQIGELSGDRMVRLSRELGVPFELMGSAADTSPCGAQTPGTYLANMQAAADTDQGILREPRDGFGLEYITRTAMLNQPSRISYSHSGTHDMQSFQIIDDDRTVRNKITSRRTAGSFAIAEVTVGGTSTADPPSGIGEYPEDLTWELAADSQLLAFAGWRALIRSWDEPRYPATAIWRERSAIATVPALDAATLALDIADRYTITSPPVDLPPDSIALAVQGYDELIANFEHRITLDGTASGPYDVWEIDSPTTRVTDDHFLKTAVNAAATSWDIANSNAGMQLIADDPQDGWDWMIDGERVTVTDVAPPSIAFVGVGTASTGASGSRTPGLPAGVATGNVVFILASTRNSGTGTVDTLANWQMLYRDGNIGLMARIYDGVWTMPTVTYTGGAANEDTIAQSAAFSGKFNDATKLRVASAGRLNSSAQDIAVPGLPMVGLPENCAALYFGWKQDDYTGVATPAGWTELQEASSVAGNDASQIWGYQLFTTRPAANSLQPALAVTGGAAAISRGAVLVFASDYQTVTVTRSVNTVSKAHSAGAVPRLTPPPHLAM
jgi:hypothetical protein